MARSKRSKLVTLSKVKKVKTKEWKRGVIAEVQSKVEAYPRLFVLRYENVRNDKLQQLREKLKASSRFCLSPLKVTRVALGRTESEEIQEGLADVANTLKGNVGLFFTKLPKEEVLQLFSLWKSLDFARAGSKATKEFSLQAGPLIGPEGPVSHTLEPFLRQHKLPVKLNRGVVELLADHKICEAGQTLSPDQAALLKVFGIKMALFRFTPIACWEKDGGRFERLEPWDQDEDEGNLESEDEDDFGGVKVPGLPAGIV